MSKGVLQSGEARPYLFERELAASQKARLGAGHRDDLERNAYEKGYLAGEHAGFQAGLEKAQAVGLQLEEVLRSLEQARREFYGKLEAEMLDLSLRIAEKVIRRELQEDRAGLIPVLSAALRELQEEESIMIRVSPEDLKTVRQILPIVCEQQGVSGKVVLQEDAGLGQGDCILETDRCEIDARVERSLRKIVEALGMP